MVLTLYLSHRNESQAVTGEWFGCSPTSVSPIAGRLRPPLRGMTAERVAQVGVRAQYAAVLVDGFLAPTGDRTKRAGRLLGEAACQRLQRGSRHRSRRSVGR